ncbi:MAG: TonB family protein, partial [Nodosilinea sp.]
GPGRDGQPAQEPNPVAIVKPPVQEPTSGSRQAPKCVSNCGLSEYLGAEGTTRFIFDVDANGKVANVRLRQSSGNPELDRKAEAAIRRRQYEASESGYEGQRLRVTSELQGSDFQRQNQQRRQQEAAEPRQREAEQPMVKPSPSPAAVTQAAPRNPPVKPAMPPETGSPAVLPSPVETSLPTPVAPSPTQTPPAAN